MGVLIFNPAHSQETMAQFRESLRADNRHKELMKSMKQQNIDSSKSYQRYVDTMHSELEMTRKAIGKQTLDIVASNEAIEEAIETGFEMVNNTLHNIDNSIESFRSDFRIAMSELIQQQRITNLLLENVSELLKIPDSEKERYNYLENGLKHYKNGLFKDSLNNLLYVEKIRTEKIGNEDNYFVLYNIGLIYLLQYDFFDAKIALKYFEQAAKYAEVETKENSAKLLRILEGKTTQDFDSGNIKKIASESYYYAAFTSYLLSDFNKSIKYCQKAMELNPKFAEAVFLCAKSQSLNNNVKLAVMNLDGLVRRLPEYSIKVSCDGDLCPKQEVKEFLQNLRDEFVHKVKSEYTNLSTKYKTIIEKCDKFSTDELNQKYILPLNNKLEEISNLISKNSYLDSLKAIKLFKVYQIETKINEFEKDKNDVFILHKNIINFEDQFETWDFYSIDKLNDIKKSIVSINKIKNKSYTESNLEFNKMLNNTLDYINKKITNLINHKKQTINKKYETELFKLETKIKNYENNIQLGNKKNGFLFWFASFFFGSLLYLLFSGIIGIATLNNINPFLHIFSYVIPVLISRYLLFRIQRCIKKKYPKIKQDKLNLRNKIENEIEQINYSKDVLLLEKCLKFFKSLKELKNDCH